MRRAEVEVAVGVILRDGLDVVEALEQQFGIVAEDGTDLPAEFDSLVNFIIEVRATEEEELV